MRHSRLTGLVMILPFKELMTKCSIESKLTTYLFRARLVFWFACYCDIKTVNADPWIEYWVFFNEIWKNLRFLRRKPFKPYLYLTQSSFNIWIHEVWLQCLKRHMAGKKKIKVPSSLSNATQLQQCLQENACFQMWFVQGFPSLFK